MAHERSEAQNRALEQVQSEWSSGKVIQLRANRDHKRALRMASCVRPAPLSTTDRVVLASLFTAAAFAVGALVAWGLR